MKPALPLVCGALFSPLLSGEKGGRVFFSNYLYFYPCHCFVIVHNTYMTATLSLHTTYGNTSVVINRRGAQRSVPCASKADARRTYHAYHRMLSNEGYRVIEA